MNAKDIIVKAIQCDQSGRVLEAQNLYQDGIQLLMDAVADENDVTKKKAYYERIKDYIDRAEQIKDRLQKLVLRGELIDNIPIDEDSAGHSYQSLFGKYLNCEVKELLLEEPYLYERFQFQNLITFLELVIKNCKHLKYIRLVTKSDKKSQESIMSQKKILDQIKSDIMGRGVSLNVKYEDTLHDRKIVLSNGYIIKIGRGLHFYKATNPLYSLGLCDYDFRKCKQTDVDIWRTKNLG